VLFTLAVDVAWRLIKIKYRYKVNKNGPVLEFIMHYAMRKYWGAVVWIQVFLTSALVVGEGHFYDPSVLAQGKSLRYPLDKRLGGSQSRSGRCGGRKF
jgi:hypothetical protein